MRKIGEERRIWRVRERSTQFGEREYEKDRGREKDMESEREINTIWREKHQQDHPIDERLGYH